jgi:hypothetical protein
VSDGGSAARAGIGILEPWLDAVLMELMLASQLHSFSRSFLANCAVRLKSRDLLQLLVLLISYWSTLIFLAGKVNKPDEGDWGHGEEGRHNERNLPHDADCEEGPFFLVVELVGLRVRLCGNIEGDVLCGVILMTHLLNGL